MLAFYHRIARRLYPARLVLWMLTAASAAAFLLVLFNRGGAFGEPFLLPMVLVFAWMVAALSVTYGFYETLPSARPGARALHRIAVWAKRAYLWLMAALMSAVSIALALLCIRAVAISLRG